MKEEDIKVRRIMEASDMPKLPDHFRKADSFAGIAWEIYKENILKMTKFLRFKTFKDAYNDPNPLISLYT